MRAKANTRRKKLLGNGRRGERLLFYYPLCLPGDSKNPRLEQFTKSYVRLGEWMVAVRNKKLRQRVAEFRKTQAETKRKFAATISAYEILRETADRLDDPSFDAEEFRRRFFATGLSREELRALFDELSTPSARGVEVRDEATIAQQEKELRVAARKTRRDLKHLRDETVIFEAIQRLFDSAVKLGDEGAAKALHSAAQIACAFLGFLAHQKLDLIRPTARISQHWPILLGASPGSTGKAAAELERLQIGADTIYGRLRLDRAFHETTAARTYARVLVETIWINRTLIPELSERLRAMEVMDPDFTTDFEDLPHWFRLIAPLPQFSNSSVDRWGKAAREILRKECPEFHLRPEWASVRRSFGPHEKGRIQNKIIDKIVSAMRTIARTDDIKVTQKSLPKLGNDLR